MRIGRAIRGKRNSRSGSMGSPTRSGLDIGVERACQAGIGDIAAAVPDASTDICRMKVVFEAMIRRLGLSGKPER